MINIKEILLKKRGLRKNQEKFQNGKMVPDTPLREVFKVATDTLFFTLFKTSQPTSNDFYKIILQLQLKQLNQNHKVIQLSFSKSLIFFVASPNRNRFTTTPITDKTNTIKEK